MTIRKIFRNKEIHYALFDQELKSKTKFGGTYDLNGIHFINCSFYEIDLSGLLFLACKFSNCFFHDVRCRKTEFLACSFESCQFFDCDLGKVEFDSDTSFLKCSFQNINFWYAYIDECVFIEPNFRELFIKQIMISEVQIEKNGRLIEIKDENDFQNFLTQINASFETEKSYFKKFNEYIESTKSSSVIQDDQNDRQVLNSVMLFFTVSTFLIYSVLNPGIFNILFGK